MLYGSIVGNVKDKSNDAVTGATIKITHKETNQTRETATNSGRELQFLDGSDRDLHHHSQQGGIQILHPQQRRRHAEQHHAIRHFAGSRGRVETISITAEGGLLQTDRAEVRAELTSQALQNLPVPAGRNYQNLFRTLPGINPPTNAHSIPTNPSRALQYNVNGTSSSSNNVRIDGASQYNIFLPHVTAYVPALESIETVNIVTNNFDAEQGLAGGAAVSVQIKSGTNNIHGSGV